MDRQTVREFFQQFKKRHWKGRSADACRGYRNAITRMAAYLQRDQSCSSIAVRLVTSVPSQLVVHSVAAGGKRLASPLLESIQIANKQGMVQFDLDVASRAEAAVVRLADLFGQANVVFQGHGFVSR